MTIGTGLRRGLAIAIIDIFILLLGVTALVGRIVSGWFRLSSEAPGAWLLLAGLALWGGVTVSRSARSRSWAGGGSAARAAVGVTGSHSASSLSWEALVGGLLAGAVPGLIVAIFVWGVSFLLNLGIAVREWLVQLTPDAIGLFTIGLPPLIPAGLLGVLLAVAGLLGALLAELWACFRLGEWLRGQWQLARGAVLDVPAVHEVIEFHYTRYILYGVGLLLLLILPLFLGQYWNYTLGTVGIYVILGVGLNVVVGLAGLLDLGYVAFFAIGAYTVALLTAPTPHGIQMSFWLVLPIGIALAAITGVLLGIPVLRMRGDYLAIVTLGFGEIIRILSKSDVLTSFTGGPRGVRNVGGPNLLGIDLNNEFFFLYFIIAAIILVVFVSSRLQNSRVGRAWMAMRDDEDVAKAMGIYVLKYKLLAFAVGAAFAGLGGVLYASRNRFTGPEDFTLLVSINVLCLVIVGGMGSIPGVVMGALVLKGLPEVLRELQDYRMLVFGGLLVVMMILRPEGIWPSQRRSMELREALGKADESPKP
jgi:ABC-type branched-subunit amino acid transport system permease subunit